MFSGGETLFNANTSQHLTWVPIVHLIECSAHAVACIMFTLCTEQCSATSWTVFHSIIGLSSMTGHCAELISLADLNLLLQNGSTVFNQAISHKRECCGAEYQHCHDLVRDMRPRAAVPLL